ncbi:yfkN, partial [Fragariocoptes setiger]
MIMTETEITNDSCSTNENGRQHVISEESQVSISERPQSIAITTTVTDINTQDGIKVSTPESGYIEVDDDTTNNSHQSTADERVVTIIHFNDCYNVEPTENESSGAAGFLTAINQYRHLNPLILFSGDIISPSFMSTFTKGEQMIDVLNSIKVDCAVFGNHEFDSNHQERLTTFPWLLSNVIDKETSTQLGDGKVYEIIERNGVKFGLIGLIEEEWLSTLSTISPSDVIYKDFCVEGRQLATWLKQEHQVDYVIALTHMRTPNDIKLADAVPEIDLFLGGHDHVYEIIKRPNGRCIIKSGTDFREFSKIEIVFTSTNTHPSHNHHHQSHCKGNTASDNSLSSLSIALVPSDMRCERIYTLNHPEDAELKKKLEKYHTTINERMNVVLGQFNCDLDGTFSSIRTSETNLGNFVCDIMLASNSADVAILNSGTLRSDRVHRRGDFTMRDLFNILGYIDPIAVLLASGYQIWKALENGVSQWPRLEGRFPQVSGCSFEFDPRKPPGERINPASITIGYESIDLN